MSRFGNIPVLVPQEVKVEVAENTLKVAGPKGSLERKLPRGVEIKMENGKASVSVKANTKQAISNQGSIKSHLNNMVIGVTNGWKKEMEMSGSGYRAEVKGSELVLSLGYSHPIIFNAPKDVNFKVEKNNITVEGLDKEVVGQIAALIRASRKPDPYKAKGIKYADEVVRRKAGKQAAKTA